MSATDIDPTSLADEELKELLGQLEDEERQLSRRRDALHRRIDFVRAGGGGHDGASAELLASLDGEERFVSKERKGVQRRLDGLRAEQLRRQASR